MREIDIHALSEIHPEWFEADGIHPNKDGAKVIADEFGKKIIQTYVSK